VTTNNHGKSPGVKVQSPTTVPSTTEKLPKLHQVKSEQIEVVKNPQLDTFEQVDLKYILGDLATAHDENKDGDDLQAERDAIIKLTENIKRNMGMLEVEYQFIQKDSDIKIPEISNYRHESNKIRGRHSDSHMNHNRYQAENQNLLNKKHDLQLTNEKLQKENAELEKQLKILETRFTEDDIQDLKIKQTTKINEMEILLTQYQEEYRILYNAINNVSREYGTADSELQRLKSTSATPSKAYFSRAFESPLATYPLYSTTKASNVFTPRGSTPAYEPIVPQVAGFDIDLRSAYDTLERARQIRNGITENLKNRGTIIVERDPNIVAGTHQQPKGSVTNKKVDKKVKNISFDQNFFKQLTKIIADNGFVSHLNVFKEVCLQHSSTYVDTEFFSIDVVGKFMATNKEYRLKLSYQNKSSLEIKNFGVALSQGSNVKLMSNIQSVVLKPGQSITQDFVCAWSEYKYNLPTIRVAFMHSAKRYEQTIVLPLTINKFSTSIRLEKDEFIRKWKPLLNHKVVLEDRKMDKNLFSSINELKEVFDNTVIVKNDPHRGRANLGFAFELPDKHLYLVKLIVYDNGSKFDLKITSSNPNNENVVNTLQTLAFLFNEA
jgi:hypothetical protein